MIDPILVAFAAEAHDRFGDIDLEMWTEAMYAKHRHEVIRNAIEAGNTPTVARATYIDRETCTAGDLCEMGWAKKHYIADADGDVEDVVWKNTAPGPVVIGDQLLQPGEWTE